LGELCSQREIQTEAERAGALNNVNDQDPRADPDRISFLKMQSVLRMVILKVMHENNIDVFVNPEQTTPPYVLGGAPEPEVNNRPSLSCCGGSHPWRGAGDRGAGRLRHHHLRPAVRAERRQEVVLPVTGDVETKLPYPMPISLMFWAGPGSDSDVIKVASAYEAATHHRVPPAKFGPLPAPTQTSSR
jgi:amidase